MPVSDGAEPSEVAATVGAVPRFGIVKLMPDETSA